MTRQGELTPLSRVKFSHVNVSRWGNPPSRGRIRDTKFAQNSVFSGSHASLLKVTIESQSTEACSKEQQVSVEEIQFLKPENQLTKKEGPVPNKGSNQSVEVHQSPKNVVCQHFSCLRA